MKYYNKKTGEEITVLKAEKLRDNEKIVKYNAEEIAESYINGNLSWVKEKCLNNIPLIASVIKTLEGQEKENFINWLNLW